MTGKLSQYLQGGDASADAGDSRAPTRRRFLGVAATTGLGLATVGALHDGDGPGSRPPSRSGGQNATGTTAARDDDEKEPSGSPGGGPVIGANLNGRPHRLRDDLELLEASNTSWVRAFLDVRNKLADGRAPEDDPDVVTLRRAAREQDCKLVVSLKWDFRANWGDKEPINVPPPGSSYERELLQCAERYLGSIGAPVDVVVLGNEPMWETLDEDIKVDDAPVVQFTRNVKQHLVEHGDHGDPSYLVGAFNRSHDPHVRGQQYSHFFRQMSEMVREDEDVDGVDLHLHYVELEEAEDAVALAREEFPDGTITATEFSPVWRYHRHTATPISEFEVGEQFALEHDLPAGMTVVEYFEEAKRDPRTPGELADFYDAMPWYNVNHVEDVYSLFSDYDVSVGTFGFLQGLGMRNEDWTADWLPFHINFLYQPALMRAENGLEATANPHYIDDYRNRAVRE